MSMSTSCQNNQKKRHVKNKFMTIAICNTCERARFEKCKQMNKTAIRLQNLIDLSNKALTVISEVLMSCNSLKHGRR